MPSATMRRAFPESRTLPASHTPVDEAATGGPRDDIVKGGQGRDQTNLDPDDDFIGGGGPGTHVCTRGETLTSCP
jgi:hypothetical protein